MIPGISVEIPLLILFGTLLGMPSIISPAISPEILLGNFSMIAGDFSRMLTGISPMVRAGISLGFLQGLFLDPQKISRGILCRVFPKTGCIHIFSQNSCDDNFIQGRR